MNVMLRKVLRFCQRTRIDGAPSSSLILGGLALGCTVGSAIWPPMIAAGLLLFLAAILVAVFVEAKC